MKYGWHLQRMFGIGLAPGLAVLEVLEGSGLPIAEQLAREVIQNSCDAAREFTPQAGSGPVRVVFRFRRLEGEERERFLDLLDLGSSSELRTRISHLGPNGLGLRAGNVLQNPNRPVSVLYIEDFGTRGLRGDPS
ncbi:MAG: hypothetical protein NZL87_05100, partial [Thermomicrobium sp.]|nr:hypothetical protein [Thermomicrobium sp.]